MKKLFFFSGDGKKKQPQNRLNEWHVNFFFGKKKYSQKQKKWAVFFFFRVFGKKKNKFFEFE